jgi:hypothetical protein
VRIDAERVSLYDAQDDVPAQVRSHGLPISRLSG